jgi:hypothetical protein
MLPGIAMATSQGAFGTWQDAFGPYTGNETSDSGWNGYTFRGIIPTAYVAVSGTKIRVTVKNTTSNSVTIGRLYIGEKAAAGDAYDFASTPTQILFSGGASVSLTGNYETKVSDEITFSLDASKSYIYAFDNISGDGEIWLKDDMPSSTFASFYTNANDASTVNASGYTTYTTSALFLVSRIEAFS